MGFQPDILNPSPDPWFMRELRKIDPNLRVVWGYGRYLVQQWAIERKLSPERYFTLYKSLLESGGPRFVKQPIFDSTQPIYDDQGEFICYRQIGERDYDLAPEYEWVRFERVLNEALLGQIKRSYAWERNHPLSRIRFEKQRELDEKRKAAQKKRLDAADVRESIKEAQLEVGKIKQFGYGKARSDG